MNQMYQQILRAVLMVSIFAPSFCVNPVFGAPITLQIASLTGTVDPIIYTDFDGTFTTSPLTLTLSSSSPSSFTFDTGTGAVSDHTVMDISFNNGKPGPLNGDLSGIFTVDENGTLTPAVPPIDFTADLTISSAILSGAGPFDGTIAKGKNPTFKNFFIEWRFGKSQTGQDNITIDLPPTFINGTNIPISGEIIASVVPEPTSISLLLAGALGFFIKKWLRKFG